MNTDDAVDVLSDTQSIMTQTLEPVSSGALWKGTWYQLAAEVIELHASV